MAGFSDRAMRRICHDLGAEYSVTEMVSAKAVTYNDKKTFLLSQIREDEGPVGLQIFGSEPDVMARAAHILSAECRDGCVLPRSIDINMGCPVAKIFGNGEGSALMRDPELIYRIVRAVTEATDLPVSVKLRAGVDPEHVNAVECAAAAESAGASMITVHGRTRVQMYSGKSDREIIKKVKQSVHIPVVANGDILCGADALSMLEHTGADGVAVGRAAVGNPYIFSEIRAMIEGREYTAPDVTALAETALLQLRIACEDKGEGLAVRESRKQIALYLHSFSGAASLRAQINRAVSYDEVERILSSASERRSDAE